MSERFEPSSLRFFEDDRAVEIPGARFGFGLSLRRPESLEAVPRTDVPFEKLVGALAFKLGVETEYGKTTGAILMKYFPAYFVARVMFRHPLRGDEILRIPADCLRKANGTYFLLVPKRIRKSSETNERSRKSKVEFEENLYARYWIPTTEDVARAICAYRDETRLREDAFLFDNAMPMISDEAKLKELVGRCNMFVDEFLGEDSRTAAAVRTAYGLSEIPRFDVDKRSLLNVVRTISERNFLAMNEGLSEEAKAFVLHGPSVSDLTDEDEVLKVVFGNGDERTRTEILSVSEAFPERTLSA